MSFDIVSVTAETDCSLTVPLTVTAVSGKNDFRSVSILPAFDAPVMEVPVGIVLTEFTNVTDTQTPHDGCITSRDKNRPTLIKFGIIQHIVNPMTVT